MKKRGPKYDQMQCHFKIWWYAGGMLKLKNRILDI